MIKKKSISLFFIVLLISLCNYSWVSIKLQGGFKPQLNNELPSPLHTYDELSQYMGKDEGYYNAKITQNEKLEVSVKGLRKFNLEKIDAVLNDLHISEKLTLYSMVYLSSFLEDLKDKPTLTIKLTSAVKQTLEHVESKTLFPDKMKINDHVISVRLENLILLYAFLEEYHNQLLTKNLKEELSEHISWCNKLLMDKKHFRWSTNHGLMQIRALFAFGYAYDGTSFVEKSNKIANERANELIDYHIASDGSVYESASSYWFYIYKLWKRIAAFPVIEDELEDKITNRLSNTKDFLNSVTMNSGFLQGIGDARNQFISDSNFTKNQQNILYRYGNGLAGIRAVDDSNNEIGVFFTALYNPPSVHEHPEDLSVYIYKNETLFINPGVYAYDGSWKRSYVLSQEAQNTVFSKIQDKPDSSIINDIKIDEEFIEMKGRKYYGNSFIQRILRFFPDENKIVIQDSASNKNLEPITQFNIHPDQKIKKLTDKKLILQNGKNSTKLSFNKQYSIDTGFISPSNSSTLGIKKINLNGKVKTEINLGDKFQISDPFKKIADHAPDRTRKEIGNELGNKYSENMFLKQGSLKSLLYSRVALLSSYFVLCAIILLFFRRKLHVSLLIVSIAYLALAITDIFYNGVFISVDLYQFVKLIKNSI